MRVEFPQNIVYRNIYDAVGINLIYILIVDVIDKAIELVFLRVCGKKLFRRIVKMQLTSYENSNRYSKREKCWPYVIIFLIHVFSSSCHLFQYGQMVNYNSCTFQKPKPRIIFISSLINNTFYARLVNKLATFATR